MKKADVQNSTFVLDSHLGYFRNKGVDVMAFDDIYPAGHQSGVSIIMHGSRLAANGDVRFEPTPGQWQPVPKQGVQELDEQTGTITTHLSYPDLSKHLKGFNPMIYPDYRFTYTVTVKGQGESVLITVDLGKSIPEEYVGKLCFNLELFPGALFGKPWIMDEKTGIFPRQPNVLCTVGKATTCIPGIFPKSPAALTENGFPEITMGIILLSQMI